MSQLRTERSSRMVDDMGDSLLDIRARCVESKITTQLVNIQTAKVPQQKSLEFLNKLKCLYFTNLPQRDVDHEAESSAQPILKLVTINAFTRREYVALSYTWKPSSEETGIPNGGYLVEDICSGKVAPSSVRNTVFSRIKRYMDHVSADYLWIDKHCIEQEEGEAKEIGMQAMDRVYSLSYHPVTLLSRTIKTLDQLQLLIEILSENFVVRWENQYWLSSSTTWQRARRALQLLNYITSDTWFSRGWTYQENYRAGPRMILLISHSATIRDEKPLYHFGSLDGELCINSVKFHEQATKLCLAYSSHQPPPNYLKRIISRAGRYTILLQSDDGDDDSAEDGGSAPVSMSPTIIEDIANRELDREWDRLAITANCCQYVNRLDSTKLQGKHSLSLSLLALCLMNGEILSNHPADDVGDNSARMIPITEFLHMHFFDGLRSPKTTKRLTFNKSCRFSDVILTEEGVKTEGYLWRLDDEIPTTDFHHYGQPPGGRRRRYQRRPRPLEWLAGRLAGHYRILSERLYDILNLDEPSTPGQEWQLRMVDKIEEAIDQEKWLCTATLLGPGPLGVAIFVIQPGDDDNDSDEIGVSSEICSEMSLDHNQNISVIHLGAKGSDAEPLLLDEGCYAFTSFQPEQWDQQSFDYNDLNKQVSLEVDCCFGTSYRRIPQLYTRRWIHGLCFFYGCSPRPVVFPWPASLQDL